MANSDINTTTVNRRGKFFRLIDGTILEFTAMLDCNCNPTDNPDECIIAMYEIPDGLFKGVDLRLFSDDNSNERASVTDIQCTAINRREMFFRLIDGTILEFTAMLDCNCNPTDNPDECVVAICKLPDGLFRAIDLRILDDHPDMWETLQ
jgi:hypothetical protein